MFGTDPHRLHVLTAPMTDLVSRVRDWPAASQQRARRNAMVATTACARRRAEREEVADYLESRARPRRRTLTATVTASPTAPPARRAARG